MPGSSRCSRSRCGTAALHFDDEVECRAIGAVRGATFQIAYLLTVGAEARATAVTVHGCVDGGRPVRLPAWVARSGAGAGDKLRAPRPSRRSLRHRLLRRQWIVGPCHDHAGLHDGAEQQVRQRFDAAGSIRPVSAAMVSTALMVPKA